MRIIIPDMTITASMNISVLNEINQYSRDIEDSTRGPALRDLLKIAESYEAERRRSLDDPALDSEDERKWALEHHLQDLINVVADASYFIIPLEESPPVYLSFHHLKENQEPPFWVGLIISQALQRSAIVRIVRYDFPTLPTPSCMARRLP